MYGEWVISGPFMSSGFFYHNSWIGLFPIAGSSLLLLLCFIEISVINANGVLIYNIVMEHIKYNVDI